MSYFIDKYEAVCRTRKCSNRDQPFQIIRWDGSPVGCGVCGKLIVPEPAVWHVPPTPEELGMPSAPERAAELIAQMTSEERAELAALIAPDNE